MIGVIGIAILVGLCAAGIALFSGASILMVLGSYILFGWLFIIAALIVVIAVKIVKRRVQKQNPAYSS
ncbi:MULTISPECIES: hypothetical protein [unclassified Ruegeria]|uniref:hypothetical protein n=1 Tax=unclassified Ruegeria TaxID=2625375 RepID=UPI0014923FBC|nr:MULTISPECIES: hypothetical protein [unclassified Ruegeria]NOD49810.1 hypothetical protein [Ruegeria sp. HKCCD5849]NOD54088.1 hypothetical protein [Ruegeria sp. HKCCD5851]NOD70141.1 hypothetical protein [Ruegeria sp. HKCCD7303]